MASGAYKVLFVCTGNICRSPTAEAVFRHHVGAAGLANRITVASAGTHTYHVGESPHSKSIEVGAARGFDLSALRARKLSDDDFRTADLVLAMDNHHLLHLSALKPSDAQADIKLFLNHHPKLAGRDVPDPYYGKHDDFVHVLTIIDEGSQALLAELRRTLKR